MEEWNSSNWARPPR